MQSCWDQGKLWKSLRISTPSFSITFLFFLFPKTHFLVYLLLNIHELDRSYCCLYLRLREMFRWLLRCLQWLNLRSAMCSLIIWSTMCTFLLCPIAFQSFSRILSPQVDLGQRIGWWFELVTLLSWIRQNERELWVVRRKQCQD